MLAAIAHDLRGPLMRMRFRLAAVPDEAQQPLLDELREMERLIRKTLDFIEHETRSSQFELVNLTTLVETVVDDYIDMERNVAAGEIQDVAVFGDAVMLKRTFVNLIDNALKYGESARVSVIRSNGLAHVEILDQGLGIPSDAQARVFEPFYRLDAARSPSAGGTGLGLAIVKSAVEAHGGTVTLGNLPQGGCRVCVTLPADPRVET